jgi:type II secretory pathway pseudopilin PulG
MIWRCARKSRSHAATASCRGRTNRAASNGGFTYLTVLFLVAMMGAGLVGVAQFWHVQAKREKEAELLFIGSEFRRSIGAYYERSPGGQRQFPKQLSDLLQDPRYPDVQRHLRRVYIDPMTGKAEWALLRAPDGGIIGVHSLSKEKPIKIAGFTGFNVQFADAAAYQDWKFAYLPADARGMAMAAQSLAKTGVRVDPSAIQAMGIPPPMPEDPVEAREKDMIARQTSCGETKARDLRACGEAAAEAGMSDPCIAEVLSRYHACISAGGGTP